MIRIHPPGGWIGLVTALMACLPLASPAEESSSWDHYGGGLHGMQYSALTQISRDNVAGLREAWRYRTGENVGVSLERLAFQANPILARGRLYLATGSAIVVALDPASGEESWRYDPQIDRSKPHAEIANRGVTSWIDPRAVPGTPCGHRIFVGTLDARLIALDGDTGRPCKGFGSKGQIRLDHDIRVQPSESVGYTVTSPPVVVGDTLVVGSAIGDNRAVESELGIVRGIDARSGQERWRWDPVPRQSYEPGYADWNTQEAVRNGSANAWAPLAADPALGLVYVPTGSASPDFYGGEREGDNRYANSLVALNAGDGSLVWARQLVHHDVWDYDLASQPTLVDLDRGDATVPAVIQGTKTGLVFTFDRRDGTPLFDIEERPVPQGGVPGEHLSPTQPFPVAPPPIAQHQAVTPDDAWGLVYFDTRACRKRIASLTSLGAFTPPGIEGIVQLPGYAGGINWGGLAFDPVTQTAVTFAVDLPMEVALIPRDELQATMESGDFDGYEFALMEGTPYAMRRALLASPLGLPCTPPPWGLLTAIDMRAGTIRWQRPVGSIQDVAPAFVPNLELGVVAMGGPIVTGSGLVFMAGSMDDYLRAFDLDTGDLLWEGRLPAGGQATPMTYALEETGTQYVVIAAGGHPRMGTTPGDYVIAFALPDPSRN